MRQIVLYSTPECHLCHTARRKLERVRRVYPFRLQEVDIRTSPELERRYGERIPVVAIDGRERLVSKVTEFGLLKALIGAPDAPPAPAPPPAGAPDTRP
jgi:glutaredoxin